jgi:hypothetical protein
MGGRLAAIVAASAATVGLLIAAPAAEATFHLIKVREVYPGAGDDTGFVELQMYAGGQTQLSGHKMTVYNSAGALIHTSTFSSGVAHGENQRTILIGDSNVATVLRVAPDLVDSGLEIPAAGGAACWNAGGIPADCVAWGDFSGGVALHTATGTTAGSPVAPGGILAGEAILRTIAPGCPTLLEESDDSDDSATDFAVLPNSPNPRNNATTPTEHTCPGAPNTAIDDKPALNSPSAEAEFTYEAPTATSYECKLDAATFATCPNGAPQIYTGLADGTHSFQVRGVNASGPDPTPAAYTWTVDTVAPTATIASMPANPSPGASAAFGFHASESASFECSLAPVGQPDAFSACTSVTTYKGLADGLYLFKVRATDAATNTGAPASYQWEVDNSLLDTTPPETTIDSKPADPSASSTASFSYRSNESGSSFECALDGAAFAPCPAAGISYASLANGPHSFQVRAIDPSSNVDPTPAGYSFSVAVPVSGPGPSPSPPAPRPLEPPRTILASRPAARTRDQTPTFRFQSDRAGAGFECAVDRQPFRPCHSPLTTKRLKPGRHTVSIRAVVAGLADQTPDKISFTILGGN